MELPHEKEPTAPTISKVGWTPDPVLLHIGEKTGNKIEVNLHSGFQTDRQTGACCRNGRAHSYSSQILIINFLGRRSHLGTNIHQPPRVSTPSTATLLAQLECFNCHYSRGEWRHTSQRASSNPLALLSNPPLKNSPFLPKRVKLIAALSNYD